ncbi:MAG: hypothetical protein ACLUOD_12045 [[Clostridium] innocuum]
MIAKPLEIIRNQQSITEKKLGLIDRLSIALLKKQDTLVKD